VVVDAGVDGPAWEHQPALDLGTLSKMGDSGCEGWLLWCKAVCSLETVLCCQLQATLC
jgi:hypothetical protein